MKEKINYWLFADAHLGHNNLCKEEYESRPENFSELILYNMLHTIQQSTDIIICLGDVCIGNDKEWHEKLMERMIPINKILVLGNHDRKTLTYYLEHGWSFVVNSFSMNIYGHKILFSHEPRIISDYYDLNIHGHCHNKERAEMKEDGKHILISMEKMKYTPIKLLTVIQKYDNNEKRKKVENEQ